MAVNVSSQRIDFALPAVDRVWLEAVPNLSTDSAAMVDSILAELEQALGGGAAPSSTGLAREATDVVATVADIRLDRKAATPTPAVETDAIAAVLDVHFDPDHQRSVWSIAGNPSGIAFAVYCLASVSLDKIDLRQHDGVHPRMGALDVVPIVPLCISTSPGVEAEEGLAGTAADPFDPGDSGQEGSVRKASLEEGAPKGALLEVLRGSASSEAGALETLRPGQSAVLMWALWAARHIAEELWSYFGIPSYFYGAAATCREREQLPNTRKPFESLDEEIAKGWLPDVGDPIAHPRWGAAAVGVRPPLVAFNVVLATADIGPARRIARQLRQMRAEGKLRGVMAMGFPLPSRGRTQVSMNLTRPEEVGVEAAFSAVLSLADREGAGVEAAEVVGLAPRASLEGHSQRLLELCPDLLDHSLEDRLLQCGLPMIDSPSST